MALFTTDLVQINKYSRPGIKLDGVDGFVLHWTANPGGTDTGHQAFFNGTDGGGGRYAGCHFFVDKDSAVLIIPENEVAYQANDHACRVAKLKPNANYNSIGLEMCVEKDGSIHVDTVKRSVEIMAYLCKKYGKTSADIYRHFDVTGKLCPKPFVENPALFTKFKKDVTTLINAVVKPKAPAFPGELLKQGSVGIDVKTLQKALGISADGIFGSGTRKAVIDFQKKKKLTADGIVGKVTWNALF